MNSTFFVVVYGDFAVSNQDNDSEDFESVRYVCLDFYDEELFTLLYSHHTFQPSSGIFCSSW